MTKETLNEVIHIARMYGWQGDYIEINRFLEYLIKSQDEDPKDYNLNPYECEYGQDNCDYVAGNGPCMCAAAWTKELDNGST